jgi:hypothetical protein
MPPVARPPKRPEIERAQVEELLRAGGWTKPLGILIRRGYYRDTMGAAGRNDIGIYDDAIAIVSPRGFWTFPANADPSRDPPGTAVLQPGMYLYCVGIHNRTKEAARQYPALIQASPVRIKRIGSDEIELGYFGINIHRGGDGTTGSEGCITVPPEFYVEFFAHAKNELSNIGAKTVQVILSERT